MQFELPKDPAILVSFLNQQLRDHYDSLDEFCHVYNVSSADIINTLKSLDYEYKTETNQFI